MNGDYRQFLATKSAAAPSVGIEVDAARLHPAMKPHQRDITAWAIRKGRAAIWADTGLGKALMALEWARRLGERTLILAPLGVAQQFVHSEGPKWGIPVTYARSEDEAPAAGIVATNYERLPNFDPAKWGAWALDEASILANFSGQTKRELVRRARSVPYRLTLTATPAPNDVVELCNQADFLGVMAQQEMLARFFTPKGVEDSANGNYRLKPHARRDFYRWLASWAVACKLPSDLGYPDDGYILPPLDIRAELVGTDWAPAGQLFLTKLKGVTHRAEVRRETIAERVERAAALVRAEPDEQWLLWYGLLDEADRLERELPGCVVLRGRDSTERKADVLLAFARGEVRILLTHPKIAGMGMNFQQCARMAFVGIDDSYVTYYQAMRRCWRFGQTRPVVAHLVLAEPQRAVHENVLRKEREAADLTRGLVGAMREWGQPELRRERADVYEPHRPILLPDWLRPHNAHDATDTRLREERYA